MRMISACVQPWSESESRDSPSSNAIRGANSLSRHPSVSLSTRLQDAHIYVMRRTFLDLLASRRAKDLDSLREQVIPWLIKTTWQKGLTQRYTPSMS